MTTLLDLVRKLSSLPEPIEFDWPGVEQWQDEVFDHEVATLEQAVTYIKALKERMAKQSHALVDLKEAYNELIKWIQSVELE